MSEIATIPTLQILNSDLDRAPRRNRTILAYVCLSLLMGMLVQQTAGIERGSWQYLVYVAAAVALPLLSLPAIVRSLFGRCWLLLLFLVWAGIWHLGSGDGRVVGQLLLFVFVMSWVSIDQAMLDTRDLVRLYVSLILIGMGVLSFTDLNSYSLIPGRALPDFGIWRVSFFPNVAYTGILSLVLLLILTRNSKVARAYPLLMIVATYFLVFSFVRAALLSALIYIVLRWWFSRWQMPQPKRMFWIALCVSLGFVALTAMSAKILYLAQNFSWISTLMLRGKMGLTVGEIDYQLYRPWLWGQQLKLFLSSPWLMGWGSADFYQLVARNVANPDAIIISAGSEALPTRLLMVYGLPGLLFAVYLFTRLHKLALVDDRWACACFPALFLLTMSWGSVFHPSDAIFVVVLLIMIRGSEGYTYWEASSKVEAERAGIRSAAVQVL
jgi:hypothetical protein